MYTFYEAVRSKKFGRTSTNMYLQYKWDVENFATHRYKVKTAKPMIDNSAPMTYTHLFVRPKKLQLELERYSTIQRNNRYLLERLATIHREGAWIDNKNYYQPRSSNTWKRQQEMIHLAHNNQIMLARLQDVKAQHNRTKLEDEYLMNQKYKANIQKFPSNWREVRKHLSRVKADIFKKCFDSKYQTESYRKSRKLALQKWALEKEKHAAAKAEKLAQEAIEAEEREEISKKEKEKATKERKMALEKRLKSSEKWKSARDERLKRAEKERETKAKRAEEKEKETEDKEKKRRQKQKEALGGWKKTKEEERKKLEEERKILEEKKKADEKLKIKLKKEELRQKREKQALTKEVKDYTSEEDKQIKDKPNRKHRNRRKPKNERHRIESTGFEPLSDDVEYEEGKGGSGIIDAETTKSDEEIVSTYPTTAKSQTDETLSAKQQDSDRQIPIDEETAKTLPSEKTLKAADRESLIEEQTGSDKETPTTELATSEQDALLKDLSEEKTSTNEQISDDNISTTEETIPDDTSSKTEETLPDDNISTTEETIPDDNSSTTEETIPDDSSSTTDKSTSDQESS